MDHGSLDLLTRLGYLAVLVLVGLQSAGVPVPGQTTLMVAAVLAGRGDLSVAGVGVAAWCGTVAGEIAGYGAGRRWGLRLVRLPVVRRLVTPGRLAWAQRLAVRRGWVVVLVGRFTGVLRLTAAPLAGMNGMRWRTFLWANAAGGALWVGVLLGLGLLVGDHLDRATGLLSTMGVVVLGGGGAVVLTTVARARRRERRAGRPDPPAPRGE